jgi:hypothetical protein
MAESSMWVGEATNNAPNGRLAACRNGAREALIVAMLAYGFAQSGPALAADQAADVVRNMQPIVGGKPLPLEFVPPPRTMDWEPATDYWQRKAEELAPTSSARNEAELPGLSQSGSPWQRLADFRSQGRIQVLTLWESPRNMISLQAGKHGGPTLQWSSRGMNRGGAIRGLLDKLVASSLGAAGLGSKIPHSSAAAPALRTISSTPSKLTLN